MQNKVPPPIWMLLFGAAMWFVARSEFAYPVTIPYPLVFVVIISGSVLHWWQVFVVIIVAFGASYTIPAIRQFGEAETTINPLKPEEASSLVTTGVFGRSRNPMYVGLAMALLAWATWLGSLTNIALIALFVVVITQLQIKPEEAALRELFGAEYDEYCRNVRRWI